MKKHCFPTSFYQWFHQRYPTKTFDGVSWVNTCALHTSSGVDSGRAECLPDNSFTDVGSNEQGDTGIEQSISIRFWQRQDRA